MFSCTLVPPSSYVCPQQIANEYNNRHRNVSRMNDNVHERTQKCPSVTGP